MDLRGHGLSDAPTDGYDPEQLAEDAIAVAEGAGLLSVADDSGAPGAPRPQPFVVAGHGYGAVVAAWAANALGDRCAGLVLVDGGWTDLAAETQMTPDEWLAAIAEPPEVLRSMAAWLADREAFDPATWGADEAHAARSEVVETAAGRVKLAIHRHALAASVAALWTFDPAAVLPAVEAEIVALVARDNDEGRHLGGLREVAAMRAATGRSPGGGGFGGAPRPWSGGRAPGTPERRWRSGGRIGLGCGHAHPRPARARDVDCHRDRDRDR
jgi:pimeloyl-ACP methyl ester carboxylesterase